MEAQSKSVEILGNVYEEYQVEWQGIGITICHCSNWFSDDDGFIAQHITIVSSNRTPLPMTNTGYRSHFMNGAEALAEFDDDPVRFVMAWLDSASKRNQWLEQQQLSLF